MMNDSILEIKSLSLGDKSKGITYVENLSLNIKKGEIVGIVGESGCGKSLTCKAILGLLPGNIQVTSGEILFDGIKLDSNIDLFRGSRITMIFQEPRRALHPLKNVGKQIEEVLNIHSNMSRKNKKRRVLEIMDMVKIPEPEKRYYQFPHQLSGGLCQRVIIGIAIAMNPDLIIADEPTTALDVTVQKGILSLLYELNNKYNTSIIFVSHDLAVVSQIADRAYVMYCGQLVEEANVIELFDNPLHPYNKSLLNSMNSINGKEELISIDGMVPNPKNYSEFCRFYDRCSEKNNKCVGKKPVWKDLGERKVRCVKFE